MIKPGTLCMIRGVPEERYGSDFNGSVVVANGFKNPEALIYWIEPALRDSRGNQFTGCRAQWLWPFEDPDTLGLINTSKELETV